MSEWVNGWMGDWLTDWVGWGSRRHWFITTERTGVCTEGTGVYLKGTYQTHRPQRLILWCWISKTARALRLAMGCGVVVYWSDCLIERLTHWPLTYWMGEWVNEWLIDPLTYWLIDRAGSPDANDFLPQSARGYSRRALGLGCWVIEWLGDWVIGWTIDDGCWLLGGISEIRWLRLSKPADF